MHWREGTCSNTPVFTCSCFMTVVFQVLFIVQRVEKSFLLTKAYVVLKPDHRTCLEKIAKALPFMYTTDFVIATLYMQRIWRICENKVPLKAFASLTSYFNSYPHQINSSNSFNAVWSVGKWKTFVCVPRPFQKHKKTITIQIVCTFWHHINADWKVTSLVDQMLSWLK